MDGRHRLALHPRVLRRRRGPGWRPAACCASGRTPTTSAATTCGRSSARSPRCSPTARCGWSATATCCWSARTEPLGPRVAALSAACWAARPEAVGESGAGRRPGRVRLLSLLVAEGPGAASLRRRRHAAQPTTTPGSSSPVPRTVFSRVARRQRGGPAGAGRGTAGAGRSRLRRAAAGPAAWRDRGWMLLEASAPARRLDRLRDGGAPRPRDDPRTFDGLVRAGAVGEPPGRDGARCCANWPRRPTGSRPRSRCRASWPRSGAVEEAAQVAFATVERQPSDVAALEQLASILTDVRDKERLVPVVGRLRTVAPTADATRYYTASLLFLDGRIDQAIAEARLLVAANPRHSRGYNLLGAALATAGRREGARDAFLASLKVEPRDPSTYTNLGAAGAGGRQPGRRPAAPRRSARRSTRPPPPPATPTPASRPRRRGDRPPARHARVAPHPIHEAGSTTTDAVCRRCDARRHSDDASC